MRVLRGLTGKALSCGCLVGTYETYDGDIVTIVDARGASCPDVQHRVRAVLADVAESTSFSDAGIRDPQRRTG